jgi:hypothetical protein
MSTQYTLQIQSLPSSIPSPIRLRKLLKCVLRTYGFRCTDFREIQHNEQPTTSGEAEIQSVQLPVSRQSRRGPRVVSANSSGDEAPLLSTTLQHPCDTVNGAQGHRQACRARMDRSEVPTSASVVVVSRTGHPVQRQYDPPVMGPSGAPGHRGVTTVEMTVNVARKTQPER